MDGITVLADWLDRIVYWPFEREVQDCAYEVAADLMAQAVSYCKKDERPWDHACPECIDLVNRVYLPGLPIGSAVRKALERELARRALKNGLCPSCASRHLTREGMRIECTRCKWEATLWVRVDD